MGCFGDTRIGYHTMCRDMTVLQMFQHPDQDILGYLLSSISRWDGTMVHPVEFKILIKYSIY